MDEVGGDDLVFGVGEDALEVGFGGLLESRLDFREGGGLGRADGEVDDRDGGSGYAEGHAGELALHLGTDERHGLGGASGRRDDVDGRAASTLPILLGGAVDGLLGGGVGVDGGHQALGDAEAFLEQDVHEGGEAVSGAGGVGDDVVLGGVVLVVVDADDNGDVLVLSRRGDDDLLGAGLEVAAGLGGLGEETRGLDDNLDAHGAPRELGGGLGGDDLDLVAVDHEHIVLGLVRGGLPGGDGASEATLGGVVLEKVGEVVGRDDVTDGDDIELGPQVTLLDEGAEDETADAAESIDSYVDGHGVGNPSKALPSRKRQAEKNPSG